MLLLSQLIGEASQPSDLWGLLIQWLVGSLAGQLLLIALLLIGGLLIIWKAIPEAVQERIINRLTSGEKGKEMATATATQPIEWQEVYASISAMVEALNRPERSFEELREEALRSRSAADQVELVRSAFSTYNLDEIDEIFRRIKKCQELFKEQFSGEDRTRCLCHVLRNVRDGNGGQLPNIDNWRRNFEQLNCASI